jgi:DNA (cytosine-5)-methyltransferase 1
VHACQDLHQADWSQVPRHDLLLASPQCTGHSRARGTDRPQHDKARSTAWAVVSAAEACRPPVIIVENVPEFRQWDSRPRSPAGQVGNMFERWRGTMETLGYACSEHVVDAADHGVAQHRVRLFCVFTRSRSPLQLRLERQAHRPASGVVDFGSGTWSPIYGRARPLAAKTLIKIITGRAQHGDRFLVPYFGSSRGGRSLDRPIGTLTTVDRYGVVDGRRYRMLTVDETREAMGFPSTYRVAVDHSTAMRLYGNAVAPPCGEAVIRAVMEAA